MMTPQVKESKRAQDVADSSSGAAASCDRTCKGTAGGLEPADRLHMFWSCAPLVNFWDALLSYLNRIFHITLSSTPLVCVLGLLEDTPGDENFRLTVHRLLYQARKLNC